ncbi:hypothetical protein [Microvirga alba]|uniref:Uncharacterized protein n=1 Tax=Microvirga alba TaxID=2791025 RepID=A0A931BVI8_9HYPH|nr:hypothetical protein [Microvirga alba]MBF9234625.1 hypothetical protein [Microvirga alba]
MHNDIATAVAPSVRYRPSPATRKNAGRFLFSAKLAWSDVTWGPNGNSLFAARKVGYPVHPRGDDPTREMLREALRPYYNARKYRDACAMVEVLLVARAYGEADMVDPDFIAFLNVTAPNDCAGIREFIRRFGPAMESLKSVHF